MELQVARNESACRVCNDTGKIDAGFERSTNMVARLYTYCDNCDAGTKIKLRLVAASARRRSDGTAPLPEGLREG